MRIALLIPSLGAGGAERVLSIMANYWAERGHEVMVLTVGQSEAPFYPLHPSVRYRHVDLFRPSYHILQALKANATRVIGLRRLMKQSRPDVAIAFMDRTSVLTILGSVGLHIPVIACVRNDPAARYLGWFWERLRKLVYPHAAAVVVQTLRVREALAPRIRERTVVIPNPIPDPLTLRTGEIPPRDPSDVLFLAMGRLIDLKGFDLLLRAFSEVIPDSATSRLEILGEGPQRGDLERLVNQLGLRNHVQLPGSTDLPADKMAAADIFVLSSRSEGFPNVLCEAMASEMAVVAFDCPNGPREIIQNGVDGILVPHEDVGALGGAMRRLLNDGQERRRLGRAARHSVLARFGVELVMEQWDQLLDSLLSRHR